VEVVKTPQRAAHFADQAAARAKIAGPASEPFAQAHAIWREFRQDKRIHPTPMNPSLSECQQSGSTDTVALEAEE
jgi:hypothetical protein